MLERSRFSLKVVFIVKNFIKESIIRAVSSSKNESILPLADIPFGKDEYIPHHNLLL